MNIRPHELSLSHLALVMGLDMPRLVSIAEDVGSHYLPAEIKLVKGKERLIEVPVAWFKAALGRLHGQLQFVFRPHPIVHGGVRGRSCFTAASKHLGRRFVIQRDIQDCYPSVTTDMMYRALLRWRVQEPTATVLSKLLTVRGHIAQGSPVSGLALNILLNEFDQRIASFCGSVGASVIRTYDDIVVSLNKAAVVPIVEARLDREIAAVGLRVNERKRRRKGLQRHTSAQVVHGLIVNSRRGVRIPPVVAARVVRWAEELQRGAQSACLETLPMLLDKRRRLLGFANHFAQASFGPASLIKSLIAQSDAWIERRLKAKGHLWRGRRWDSIAARPDAMHVAATILARVPVAPRESLGAASEPPFDPTSHAPR